MSSAASNPSTGNAPLYRFSERVDVPAGLTDTLTPDNSGYIPGEVVNRQHEFVRDLIRRIREGLLQYVNRYLHYGRRYWQLPPSERIPLPSCLRAHFDPAHPRFGNYHVRFVSEAMRILNVIQGHSERLRRSTNSNLWAFIAPGFHQIHIELAHFNDTLIFWEGELGGRTVPGGPLNDNFGFTDWTSRSYEHAPWTIWREEDEHEYLEANRPVVFPNLEFVEGTFSAEHAERFWTFHPPHQRTMRFSPENARIASSLPVDWRGWSASDGNSQDEMPPERASAPTTVRVRAAEDQEVPENNVQPQSRTIAGSVNLPEPRFRLPFGSRPHLTPVPTHVRHPSTRNTPRTTQAELENEGRQGHARRLQAIEVELQRDDLTTSTRNRLILEQRSRRMALDQLGDAPQPTPSAPSATTTQTAQASGTPSSTTATRNHDGTLRSQTWTSSQNAAVAAFRAGFGVPSESLPPGFLPTLPSQSISDGHGTRPSRRRGPFESLELATRPSAPAMPPLRAPMPPSNRTAPSAQYQPGPLSSMSPGPERIRSRDFMLRTMARTRHYEQIVRNIQDPRARTIIQDDLEYHREVVYQLDRREELVRREFTTDLQGRIQALAQREIEQERREEAWRSQTSGLSGLSYNPTSSVLPTALSDSPPPRRPRFDSFGARYSPPSPQNRSTSPGYHSISPTSSPAAPVDNRAASPVLRAASPQYNPTSPTFLPADPPRAFDPASAYQPTNPVYSPTPGSPRYSSTSPTYSPTNPTYPGGYSPSNTPAPTAPRRETWTIPNWPPPPPGQVTNGPVDIPFWSMGRARPTRAPRNLRPRGEVPSLGPVPSLVPAAPAQTQILPPVEFQGPSDTPTANVDATEPSQTPADSAENEDTSSSQDAPPSQPRRPSNPGPDSIFRIPLPRAHAILGEAQGQLSHALSATQTGNNVDPRAVMSSALDRIELARGMVPPWRIEISLEVARQLERERERIVAHGDEGELRMDDEEIVRLLRSMEGVDGEAEDAPGAPAEAEAQEEGEEGELSRSRVEEDSGASNQQDSDAGSAILTGLI